MTANCLHCGKDARLTDGREIYPHRPDLYAKKFWKCDTCDATCGCHPGGTVPLGFPADKATRNARMKLHEERLDPLWKSAPKKARRRARSIVYQRLSECMNLPPERTHTGMFTIEQCREAWKCLGEVTHEWIAARCH